jgi:glycosyltransferase involved in cell wall biosynthesis
MTGPAPRRVFFVIGSFVVGGTESQLLILADRLVSRGWNVSVLGLEKSGPLIERFESAGTRVLDGGYRGDAGVHRKLLLLAAAAVRLSWHLLKIRPHVVHAFLPMPNFLGALAGRAAFVPLIITSKRALGTHQDRHSNLKWMDWLANAASHVITANSQAVAEDTLARDGCDISRIVVIPNGVDFARFDQQPGQRDRMRRGLGLAQGDVAIAMVANLIPYKGHRELIEAFAGAATGDPRLRLFVIGEDRGGFMQLLLAEARRLGMTDRISMMGRRGDVPALLSAMDLGVVSSHEEGSSNALLEKLAVGLPVVATRIGGNVEALEGMPDCILVNPQDADDLRRGLEEAIRGLGSDQTNRQIRRRVVRERYRVDAMVDAFEQLYLRDRWHGRPNVGWLGSGRQRKE